MLRIASEPWPGNVRQLRNFLEKLFVLVHKERVEMRDVEEVLGTEARPGGGTAGGARAAQAIGVERQTLQEKIRKLGLR